MQYENQLKCHPAFLLSDVEESALTQCGRVSILDNNQVEQKIFIYKSEDSSEYEVRIYKLHPTDNYISPNLNFKFKRYVANNEFASFFFRSFYLACQFVASLAEKHPESLIRPVLENKKD